MGEEALRERLREVAERASRHHVDVDVVWERAAAARRTRQRLGVGLSALSAVCVVGLVTLAPRLVDDAPGPIDRGPDGPASSPTQPSDVARNPAGRWVAGLPSGPPPSRPYVTGSTVHDQGSEISVRDAPYTVLDSVPGGLLVREMTSARDYQFRYGVRSPDGEVAWLGGKVTDPQQRLSTDRSRLAVAEGSHLLVYDLGTRTLVDTLTTDGDVQLGQFVSSGVVYSTFTPPHPESLYVWAPGTDPQPLVAAQRLATSYGVLSDDLGRAVVPVEGTTCARAISIDGGSATTTLFEDCGLERPYTISPDGQHALTVDLRVVDLADGSATLLTGAPRKSGQMPAAVWESDDDVLLTLRVSGGVPADEALVRCSVVTLDCERVLDGRPIRVLDETRSP